MQSAPDVVAPPPGHPRFPLLDSLRAIAAIGVLVSHVGFASAASQTAWYGPFVAQGITGVTIFFVLSGFLLYRPFLASQLDHARPIRIGDFARRRVLRIVPAYWLALTVIGLWLHLRGVFGHDSWRYYGLLQVYSTHTLSGGLVAAWTLCVEISFYLLLPFYALALARLGRGMERRRRLRLELAVLAVLSLLSLVLRYWTLEGHAPDLYSTLPTSFGWFAVGMAFAVISVGPIAPRAVGAVAAHPARAWLIGGLTYLGLGLLLRKPPDVPLLYSTWDWMEQHVLSAVVAAALVAPAVFGDRLGGAPRRILAWRWLAYLGLISYGIYLWQGAWVDKAAQFVGSGRWWLPHGLPRFETEFVLTMIGTVICAALSYHLLERPLMRFKNPRPRSEPPATRDTTGVPTSGHVPVPGSGPGSPH